MFLAIVYRFSNGSLLKKYSTVTHFERLDPESSGISQDDHKCDPKTVSHIRALAAFLSCGLLFYVAITGVVLRLCLRLTEGKNVECTLLRERTSGGRACLKLGPGNLATTTIMAACYRRTVAFSGAVEDAEKWHLWETLPPALSIYYLCTVNKEKE